MAEKKIEIISAQNGRIDKAVEIEGKSRSALQNLFDRGMVTCNGVAVGKSFTVKAGDHIVVTVPELQEVGVLPENIPLDIRYEDDDIIVVNKPKGMVVHPAPGNYTGTLVNALMYHCADSLSGINGELRPGIVHRIDKDTSGLLIVAKNDFAHRILAEQIKAHSFKREYRAVVYGKFREENGTVDAPIGRHPKERKQMAVITDGHTSRNAVTHYETIENFKGFTYAGFHLETGRTHQIRVHMAYIGNPIAGDPVYGPKKVITELHGQCLHAGTIGFIHPRSKEYIEITAELPEYFDHFIQKLRSITY